MTIDEYLNDIEKNGVNEEKVNIIKTTYKKELPECIQRLVSNNDETIFLDDGNRILSFNEIVEAEIDLHIDFIKKDIIPLVDCGENDFVIYNFAEKKWSKFNVIDGIAFKKANNLKDLL